MISGKVKIVADSSSDVLSLEGLSFGNAPLRILTDAKEYVDDESGGLLLGFEKAGA